MDEGLNSNQAAAQQGYLSIENAEIFWRDIGQGQAIIVLHGGPDFDHTYLLPEMDRLSGNFRLIYYDQRGRGKSARNVKPEEVTIQSEVEDLEALRHFFRLESFTLLGHSWGGLLALEYALRHPSHLSHLILMNPAPASRADYLLFREDRQRRAAPDMANLKARAADPLYIEGDPETVAAYYRVHFTKALRQPEHLEKVIQSLRSSFTKEGILKAREIEDRLREETWLVSGYDLLPKLRNLRIPTLILNGDHDFVPPACAAHIAQAIPKARFVLLRDCGHFAYLECPDEVRKEITEFYQ